MRNPGSYACTGVRFWFEADRGCGGAEPDRPRFATKAVAGPGWYSRLGPGGATGGGVATCCVCSGLAPEYGWHGERDVPAGPQVREPPAWALRQGLPPDGGGLVE